jgi:hypothetical protein
VPPPTAFVSGSGRPRGVGIAIALGIVAVLVAVAALVVVLVRGGESSAPASPTAQPSTSSTAAASADTSVADNALCNAIAPLIKESSEQKNAFTDLGPDGSPQRDAGLQSFRDETQDWVTRAQAAFDEHAGPPRFLTRTLQRYMDDMRMLSSNLRPGAMTNSNAAGWSDSVFALAGPIEVCGKLGVPLW